MFTLMRHGRLFEEDFNQLVHVVSTKLTKTSLVLERVRRIICGDKGIKKKFPQQRAGMETLFRIRGYTESCASL